MEPLFAIGLIVFAIWAVWFVSQSQPLKDHDLEQLAQCRRQARIRQFCNFCTVRRDADLAFKKAMKADGRFHHVDYPISDSLAVIASHLKSKKHEWVVFAIVVHDRVVSLWCNKGPDSSKVWPTIPSEQLLAVAQHRASGLVIRLHNHPNSHGGRVCLLGPSEQDLRSFQYFAELFVAQGLSFIDVVCERGHWLVYGEAYVDDWFPLNVERNNVFALNGTTWGTHRRLRRELASLRGKPTHAAAR